MLARDTGEYQPIRRRRTQNTVLKITNRAVRPFRHPIAATENHLIAPCFDSLLLGKNVGQQIQGFDITHIKADILLKNGRNLHTDFLELRRLQGEIEIVPCIFGKSVISRCSTAGSLKIKRRFLYVGIQMGQKLQTKSFDFIIRKIQIQAKLFRIGYKTLQMVIQSKAYASSNRCHVVNTVPKIKSSVISRNLRFGQGC